MFFVFAGLLISLSLLALAFTQPRIATPVINHLLAERGSVAKAWIRFPAINTLEIRDLELNEIGNLSRLSAELNPFGLLPFEEPVSYLEASDGTVTYPLLREDDGENAPNIAELIDQVLIRSVTVNLESRNGVEYFRIETLTATLSSERLTGVLLGGDARAEFDGSRDQTSGNAWSVGLDLEGDNFASLARLVGLASPDTPPFRLQTNLEYTGESATFAIGQGQVGDTDITGTIDVDLAREVPFIRAELSSQTLDFDDLGIVFGLPIGVGDQETSGSAQKEAREAFDKSDRLIPNAVIDFSRLDAVDGEVTLIAERVTDSVFDLKGLSLSINIDGRLLKVTEAILNFSQGSAEAFVTLDATQSPVVTDVRGSIIDVSAEALGVSPVLTGTLQGEFQFTGTGDGFLAFAATTTGEVAIWSIDAELLALAAEATALDLGEALALLSNDGSQAADRTYSPVNCLAANLALDTGLGQFSPVVIDTTDSLIVLDGGLNLRDENLKFDIRSEAKDASWGALVGNITVSGTFRDADVEILGPDTVFQITVAAILGALAPPLAALPFIETGSANDAPCARVLQVARENAPAQ